MRKKRFDDEYVSNFFPVFKTNAENLNNAKKENKHLEQYNK